ncbi:MAG: ATP-binding protein [Lachnospiraceae bacterium]|nr:ATP-binding protein [Lachnospiraceae bacterium]
MENPFSLSFGSEPKEYILRTQQIDSILETFTSEAPSCYTYMISGVRGAGKTVLLSSIADELEKKKNWIVIHTSPDMDILTSIAAHLYSLKPLQCLFSAAKIDLSALGIGISIKGSTPVYDLPTALEKQFAELKKKNYRVLIAIDEIVNNANVKTFAGVYQILLRKKLPVFLLMTGLYENINALQNEKTLTFLYRAPKLYLEPLSTYSIARSYKRIFQLDEKTARDMAALTNGYAYAYQVLGYLYWENIIDKKKCKELTELIDEYDNTLSEYVYEKIWFELPETEKKILSVLVRNGQMKIQDIRTPLSLTDAQMSVYRDRLKRRGLVDVSRYGHLSLALPRFREIAAYWID